MWLLTSDNMLWYATIKSINQSQGDECFCFCFCFCFFGFVFVLCVPSGDSQFNLITHKIPTSFELQPRKCMKTLPYRKHTQTEPLKGREQAISRKVRPILGEMRLP